VAEKEEQVKVIESATVSTLADTLFDQKENQGVFV